MTRVAIVFCPFVPGYKTIPPLAPALLKSCLVDKGIACKTFDFNARYQKLAESEQCLQDLFTWMISPDYRADLQGFLRYQQFVEQCAKEVIDDGADVLGISLFSYECQRFAEDLSFTVKKLKPSMYIMAGGSGIGVAQDLYKKRWGEIMIDIGLIDCIVQGEAEHVIANIVTEKKKGWITIEQLNNSDLLEVPIPDFDDYEWDLYNPVSEIFIPVTGSKGCVRSCVFCDVAKIWPKFRYRNGESIAKELITLYKKYGISQFAFTDSLINGGLKPFREMNEVLSRDLYRTIRYNGQFICRDEKSMPPRDFRLMAEGGCIQVSIGIESGSEVVRDVMKKQFSDADIHYTVTQLLENKIEQSWNIIVGFPNETDEEYQKTIDLIMHYRQHRDVIKVAPVGIFQMLPGTPMTTDYMLDKMQIETTNTNGYSEYNWTTALNPGNNLRKRVERWLHLVDLVTELGMMSYGQLRISQKKHNILQQLEYYESNQPTRTVFPIREQSFQEPDNFVTI